MGGGGGERQPPQDLGVDVWALQRGRTYGTILVDLEARHVVDLLPDRSSHALGAWLRRNDLRLSPRALTLTMLLRLFVADQFVHGIGGARYDQVTDTLIARHFNLEPPRFAVTTATLYFPGAAGRTRECVACVTSSLVHR